MTEHIMKKRCSKVEAKCFHLAVNTIHLCSCFRVMLVIQNCLPQIQHGTVIIQDALKCFIAHSSSDWAKDTESNAVRGNVCFDHLKQSQTLRRVLQEFAEFIYSFHYRS